VEKILGPSESLRAEWQVDGTTGYDFMNEVAGVLHDPRGEMPLTTLWTDLTGRRADFRAVAQDARRLILDENLNSERDKTARALHGLARNDPATRDYTFAALRHALTELLVNFPVYRTYATADGRDGADRAVFEEAVSRTRPILPEADQPILDLIDAWLGGVPERTRTGRALQRRAIASFQQLTSALMAKSVEDTAFYRYGRLISRNEVGSDPAEFALARDAFHAAAARRGSDFPKAMLATATHDHKRGEDARLRIAALSEIPDAWGEAVRHWMRLNAPYRASLADGVAPEPGDEIMLYQTLIGAWPLSADLADMAWIADFRERILGWQTKAIREAKRRSRWIAPDEAYENAARQFTLDILDPEKSQAFLSEFNRFVDAIAPAAALSGLTQTFLRLTVPGVPDLYQGAEFWDLSLVDPDNRRPVDYTSRIAALGRCGDLDRVVRDWRSGHIKQFLIERMLSARKTHPRLFAEGDYRPLIAEGEAAEHAVAFSRTLPDNGETAIAVATRFPLRRLGEANLPLLPAAAWGSTSIALPERRFRDAFSGEIVEAGEGRAPLGQILARFPVAFLVAVEADAH
jgi:(1->4)-alpha-D-glucan 1-alpha-D-glucosylmutase